MNDIAKRAKASPRLSLILRVYVLDLEVQECGSHYPAMG
jgi:hypothetical protein